ncbi:lasso peptide biosynthesis PqqD family chaperone [Nocardia wallacei]|uniref:lasso peptide biosynthesis PqqD family chaperone n=1 Tax=Nocardia wallacei TaxID=480035 RepID=UPI002456F563|nr:lasso peptide biosynthesis PqqD family chaperone [Nocardia wallacei]
MNSLFLDKVSLAETDYGVMVLDERSGVYWGLNGSAAVALREFAESRSLTAAVAAVTAKYDVAEQQALDDIRALLGELRSAGLIGDWETTSELS